MSQGVLFASVTELVRHLRTDQIEFLDFGCSHGRSISKAMELFGAKSGIGVDVNPAKLADACDAGFDTASIDILALPDEPLVRFVTMFHFLEHLSGHDMARGMIQKACRVCSEFVYIVQPHFDADGQLFQHDLKCYWSDWTGHRFSMTTLDLYRILSDLRANGDFEFFNITLAHPIRSSDDPAIIPLTTNADQHEYDPALHPKKPPTLTFDFPVFWEVRVLASKSREIQDVISRRIRWHHELVRSDGKIFPIVHNR
jgi:hypothetical protein